MREVDEYAIYLYITDAYKNGYVLKISSQKMNIIMNNAF